MQNCEYRDGLLTECYSKGLSGIVQDSISLIREHLFKNANFVNVGKEIDIYISKPYPRFIISYSSERIIELESVDLIRLIPTLRLKIMSLRGVYVPSHGKIYLNKGKWCIKTIIHEALHACSLMSLVGEIDERYRPFYEGLTEFYTGYILYKAFSHSYENCWRTKVNRYCQLTYPDTTKLWCTLCHFIPLSETLSVYFYHNSLDWRMLFGEFIDRIKTKNSNKFENPLLKGGKMPIHEIFRDQCRKFFGNDKFDAIHSSHNCYTDFSKIIF